MIFPPFGPILLSQQGRKAVYSLHDFVDAISRCPRNGLRTCFHLVHQLWRGILQVRGRRFSVILPFRNHGHYKIGDTKYCPHARRVAASAIDTCKSFIADIRERRFCTVEFISSLRKRVYGRANRVTRRHIIHELDRNLAGTRIPNRLVRRRYWATEADNTIHERRFHRWRQFGVIPGCKFTASIENLTRKCPHSSQGHTIQA